MYNINFTPAAVAHLSKSIAQQQGLGLRLSVKQTGCAGFSYVPSIVTQPRAGDISFIWHQQLTVYLDPAALVYLQDLTIDFAAGGGGNSINNHQKRLIFNNPNEKSRCGCGESFHV